MEHTATPAQPAIKTDKRIMLFPVLFGIIHGVIDATTVTVIFSTRLFHHLPGYEGFLLVMVYDGLAFAGQAPLGLLIDKVRVWRGTAICGIILSALAVIFLKINPIAALAFAGLGNAAYHVGAGALSLHVQTGRATAPGIFVAPGVLGLALGTMVGKGIIGQGGEHYIWHFLAALGLSLVVALTAAYPEVPRKVKPAKLNLKWPVMIVLLLLFSIAVRSLVGRAGMYWCPKVIHISLGIAAAAFAGKAIGGVLSDRFGWIRISVGALLLSAPLLAFGGSNGVIIIIGMFIFQMTMPVTLVATAEILRVRPGFAFGLNCLAYIIGFYPTCFKAVKNLYHPYAFFGLICLSALAVYLGLRALKGEVRMKYP